MGTSSVGNRRVESRVKKFKVPHVVVVMNETPDMGKLSPDRYKIIELRD
jgi:hypothetical protein